MGGYGSGRWRGHDKKTTVEACLQLAVGRLVRDGLIAASSGIGTLSCTDLRTGQPTATLTFRRELSRDGLVFRLRYTATGWDRREHDVDEPIRLQTTRPPIGGTRWWFTCPLAVDGRACGRRAGKLYLPPGERYFGCRHCHDLTYASSQRSHRWDRFAAVLARATGLEPTSFRRALSQSR